MTEEIEIGPLPDHMREGAPWAQCSTCCRLTFALSQFGHPCRMRQPSGSTCEGTFTDPGGISKLFEQISQLHLEMSRQSKWAQMWWDLDRCPHGRHAGDSCAGWRGPGLYDGGCEGGWSLGNPLLPPGTVLGVDYSSYTMIQVPTDPRQRNTIDGWRREAADGEMLHHHLPGHTSDWTTEPGDRSAIMVREHSNLISARNRDHVPQATVTVFLWRDDAAADPAAPDRRWATSKHGYQHLYAWNQVRPSFGQTACLLPAFATPPDPQ